MRCRSVAFLLALSLTSPDTMQEPTSFDAQKALEALGAAIAGKEDDPADQVFQNVKVLGDVPAKRLLAIMRMGYARSLGVSCDHCHVAGEWASDEKESKRIARQMARMTRELNEKVLPAIPELAGKQPTVNCTTCHRGQRKPALSLD